ncbi:MAG: hypothetical protein NTU85_03430, partial [Candidatus Kaiserbacteria bacterium]|nr:hypothetical protein [Candidatus Kaiserbacteria bacterium]
GAGDWVQMAADLVEVRGDNAVSITLRRGATTVAAQSVRVARLGGPGGPAQGPQGTTQESRGSVVVLGGTTLDIQPGDRFTIARTGYSDEVYVVVGVRPNRRAGVMAEAAVVE